MKTIRIGRLMQDSGVAFGTSGTRGLVAEMTDQVCLARRLNPLVLFPAYGSVQIFYDQIA